MTAAKVRAVPFELGLVPKPKCACVSGSEGEGLRNGGLEDRPDSIGYRSLASLLERDVVSGVETAFQMTIVATALVTGLLVANVLVPPRKAL